MDGHQMRSLAGRLTWENRHTARLTLHPIASPEAQGDCFQPLQVHLLPAMT